jgi:hypothetical protein
MGSTLPDEQCQFDDTLIAIFDEKKAESRTDQQVWNYPIAQKEVIRSLGSSTPADQYHFGDTAFTIFNAYET